MPALVICGRRSNLAGDDLQPISIFTIILRLIQLGLSTPVAIFLVYNYETFEDNDDGSSAYTEPTLKDCKQVHDEVQMYAGWCWAFLSGIFLFCFCSIAQECALFVASCVGSPSDNTLRQRAIGPLYSIKLFCMPPFEALIFVIAFFIMVFTRDHLLRCLANVDGDDSMWLEQHFWLLLSCMLGVLLTMAIELAIYGILYFTGASGLLWKKASNKVEQRKQRKRFMMIQQRQQQEQKQQQQQSSLDGPCAVVPATYDGDNENDTILFDILDDEEILQQQDEKWQKRCTTLCCCCGMICCCFAFAGGNDIDQHDFTSVGHILTDLFDDGGNLDIVFSDIYMSWQLLKLVQYQRQLHDHTRLQKNDSSSRDKDTTTVIQNNQRRGNMKDQISELLFSIRKLDYNDDNKENASNSNEDATSSIREIINEKETTSHTSIKTTDDVPPKQEQGQEKENMTIDPPPFIKSKMEAAVNESEQQIVKEVYDGNDLNSTNQNTKVDNNNNNNNIVSNNKDDVESTKNSQRVIHNNNSFLKNSIHHNNENSLKNNDVTKIEEVDKHTIAQAAWFIRYPMAINTWKLYVFMHPFKCLPMCLTSNYRYRKNKKNGRLIVGTNTSSNKVVEQQSHGQKQQQQQQDTCISNGSKFSSDVNDRDIEIGTCPSSPISTNNDITCNTITNDEQNHASTTISDNNNNDVSTTTTKTTTMEEIFIGDTLGDIHRKAFLDFIEANKYPIDIAFVQVHNSVEVSPYCICVDHVWETVVICIRGSLSLEDYAINIMVDPISLDDIGKRYGFNGIGEYAHKGFLERALWVCEDIERQGVLAKLIGGDDNDPNNSTTSLYPNYTLHVVGHSLGAAVGCLVSLMLQSKFQKSNKLKCLCYGVPGILLSKSLSRQCTNFVTTFVAGEDVIPSLSVHNVEHLRNELLTLIVRTKVNKNFVIRKCWLYQLKLKKQKRQKQNKRKNNNTIDDNDNDNNILESNKIKVNKLINQLLYEEHNVPDSDCKRQVENFLDHQRTRQHDREVLNNTLTKRIQLYPPGRIVCAMKQPYNCYCNSNNNKQQQTLCTNESSTNHTTTCTNIPHRSSTQSSICDHGCRSILCCWCCRRRKDSNATTYVARWSNNNDFKEILVTDDMFAHHFPDTYETYYHNIASNMGINYTTRSCEDGTT